MSHIVKPKEKHIINAEQLSGYENTTILASAYGSGNNKRLVLWHYISGSNFLITKVQVWNHGKKEYEGNNLEEAIMKYNEF